MADEKKYLDLTGLSAFKTKLEAVMDTKDAAIKASITDGSVTAAKAAEAVKATQDASGNVITTTYETKSDASAKLAEAKGYTDSQMTAKVGTVPEGQTVMGIITNIQENAYDDTEVRGLIEDNADAISAMDTAYKAADTTLQGNIDAEAAARKSADDTLAARLDEVETFFETAEGETLDTALDTLVEIQKYLDTEGAAADQMVKDIAANTKAIEDETAAREAADTAIENAYKAADSALEAKITSAQSAADNAQSDVDDLADVVDTKAATSDLNAAVARISANETAIAGIDNHSHSNKSVLDAITAQLTAQWSEAYSKAHEHSNKTVLDGITAEKVSAWDSALESAKSYTDTQFNAIGAIDTASIDALF